MWKTLALLLTILLCLTGAFSLAAEAGETEQETFTCEDYEYALLDDGTAEITKYHGEAETLEVPCELDGYAVTAIGDDAFFDCDSLTEIFVGRDPAKLCFAVLSQHGLSGRNLQCYLLMTGRRTKKQPEGW